MKKLLLLTIAIFLGAIAQAGSVEYEVVIQNLTKGQPLTPVVLAAHSPGFKMFALGKKASAGLAAQAKDGIIDGLVAELESEKKVSSVTTGDGVILPGQKVTLSFSADKHQRLSLTTMMARTNDAIVGARSLRLPYRKGTSTAYVLGVYDAGAEINTESCEHIPAPPCNNPGQGPDEGGEGFVHSHPGVFGIQDLQVLRDSFGRVAAKVTITRK